MTERSLLDRDINVLETKYMSLTLVENINYRHKQSRILLSLVDLLGEKLFDGQEDPNNILYKIEIEGGDKFKSDPSIYDVF